MALPESYNYIHKSGTLHEVDWPHESPDNQYHLNK